MSEEKDREIVRVSSAVMKALRAYAKDRNITLGEAADELITKGVKRKLALDTYNERKRNGEVGG